MSLLQSDILEEDETEIDLDEILPPSSTLERSSASTLTARSTQTLERVRRKLKDVIKMVRETVRSISRTTYKSRRLNPMTGQNWVACLQLKHHRENEPAAVTNDGTKIGLDLLA